METRIHSADDLDLDRLRDLLPRVGAGDLANQPADRTPARGRILKLRLGFNPNSSSVGTTVVVLLWSLAASGAVVAVVSAILAKRMKGRS